jgi:hypothetical protein
MKLTPKRREILEWADRLDGRLQLLQVISSGGRSYSIVNELRKAGYLVKTDHPTVKSGGYPAEALRITEEGKRALSE